MTEFRTRDEELMFLRVKTRQLEDEIEQLKSFLQNREQIEEIESIAIKNWFGVSMGIARTLRLMSSGQPYTREQMSTEYTAESGESLRNVDSHIKRIRKSVPSIRIITIYGYGYQMEPDSAALLRRVVTEFKKKQKEQPSEIQH